MEKIQNFINQADEHEIFVMAAALAYATALALAPFTLIILALISFLNVNLQARFSYEMEQSLGVEAGAAVTAIIQNAGQHPKIASLSGLAGFVVLIISASIVFTQLQIALNKINNYTAPKHISGIKLYLKNKFLSLGLVLGFAFLSIVSLVTTAAISIVYPNTDGQIWHALSFIISFIMFTLLFTCIYRFVPTEKMNWKKCFLSGLISTVFYLIGKSLISLYLGKTGIGSAYGAAGSLIVFLVWVYYTSLTLLLSYELSVNVIFKKTD